LLIREAGGIVTRQDGASDVLSSEGNGSLVAGNAAMHRWLIDLLRKS